MSKYQNLTNNFKTKTILKIYYIGHEGITEETVPKFIIYFKDDSENLATIQHRIHPIR